MNGQAPVENPRFDGWIVVGAVFLLFVTSSGLGFYGLAIYLDAITDEQAFSNSSVSLATSLFFLVAATTGRAIAGPVERGYVRHLVVTGGALSGGSLLALGHVEEVWQLYFVYTVFAVGFAFAGLVPGTTLVTRWFHVRRSVALAVASSGLSVGGLTLTQLASWLIGREGLAGAGPWLGIAFLVLAAVSAAFMWSDPESRGQLPDGAQRTSSTPAPATGVDYQTAVQSRFFRAATAGFLFAMSAQVGSIAHLANLGSERFDRGTGALALLSLAVASASFRLLGGFVAAKVPMMALTITCVTVQAFSMVLIAESSSKTLLVLSAFIMGATVGNLLMLQALLMAEAFGVAAYARIFSSHHLFATAGIAAGPFLLGALEDASSYRLSYWAAASLSLLAAGFFLAGGTVARTQEELLSSSTDASTIPSTAP